MNQLTEILEALNQGKQVLLEDCDWERIHEVTSVDPKAGTVTIRNSGEEECTFDEIEGCRFHIITVERTIEIDW